MQLRKLDRTAAQRIANDLKRVVVECQRPDERGSALSGDLASLWRYRVGNDRVICEIEAAALLVLVIRIGHRSTVPGPLNVFGAVAAFGYNHKLRKRINGKKSLATSRS